jgi:hypothetical protein
MEGTMTVRTSQPAPKRRPPQPTTVAGDTGMNLDTADSLLPVAEEIAPPDMITLVGGQGQQGAGFSFKVQATGALFRCQVMRNPNQPRFWCITIYLCLDGGSPDKEQPRWLSNDRFTREEMPAALEAVQSNLTGWLADTSRKDLRKWILAQTSRSPMSSSPSFAKASVSSI